MKRNHKTIAMIDPKVFKIISIASKIKQQLLISYQNILIIAAFL